MSYTVLSVYVRMYIHRLNERSTNRTEETFLSRACRAWRRQAKVPRCSLSLSLPSFSVDKQSDPSVTNLWATFSNE